MFGEAHIEFKLSPSRRHSIIIWEETRKLMLAILIWFSVSISCFGCAPLSLFRFTERPSCSCFRSGLFPFMFVFDDFFGRTDATEPRYHIVAPIWWITKTLASCIRQSLDPINKLPRNKQSFFVTHFSFYPRTPGLDHNTLPSRTTFCGFISFLGGSIFLSFIVPLEFARRVDVFFDFFYFFGVRLCTAMLLSWLSAKLSY